jgi:hypothetical protein
MYSIRESYGRNIIPILYVKASKEYEWGDDEFLFEAKEIRDHPKFLEVSSRLDGIMSYFSRFLGYQQITSMLEKTMKNCKFEKIVLEEQLQSTIQKLLEELI